MRLAELTTLRVGGPAARIVAPMTTGELVQAALEVWASDEEWFVLGGGSNVVFPDDGFDGTVIRVVVPGIEVQRPEASDAPKPGRVRLRVQAGENWDALVAWTVEQGWSGIEALSGIPGSVGAAPIQNIGAYGQEVGQRLTAVEFLDFETGEVERIPADELELGYRTSVFKQGREGIVLAVELELADFGGVSEPIAYAQLARSLGVGLGDRSRVDAVRQAVLALRASKGMVLNPDDPDTASAGSFFTNPIVDERVARALPPEAPRWPMFEEPADVAVPLGAEPAAPPVVAADRPVKLSAAWLIEHAGITRGYRLPGSRAAISSKHTLALTNTGGATAHEILQLAEFVQSRVAAQFGIALTPEPAIVS